MFDVCVDTGLHKTFSEEKAFISGGKKKPGRSPPENAAGVEGFRKRAWQVEQAVLSTGGSICKGSRQGPSLDSLIPRSERQKLVCVNYGGHFIPKS